MSAVIPAGNPPYALERENPKGLSGAASTSGSSRAARPRVSSPAPELRYQAGRRLAGRYVIRELLGAGPLGDVYRAHDLVTDAEVALRAVRPALLPDDAARGRFLRGAIRARSLDSRHVVRFIEAFIDEVDGVALCVVVSEYLPRATLAGRLASRARQGAPIGTREALALVFQVAGGLSAIHEAGLVHGNLKPENIFLVGEEVRIGDVGVSSALPPSIVAWAEAGTGRDRTRAPESASRTYLAPAADVYALAAIAADMLRLTGDAPPPDVPVAARDIIWRALSLDPAQRPAEVDLFAAALRSAFERGQRREALGMRGLPAGAPGPGGQDHGASARRGAPGHGDAGRAPAPRPPAPSVRASQGLDNAFVTGALDVPEPAGRRSRPPTGPSVLLDPGALEPPPPRDSQTSVTKRLRRGPPPHPSAAAQPRREVPGPGAWSSGAPSDQPIPLAAPVPFLHEGVRDAGLASAPTGRASLGIVLLICGAFCALGSAVVRNIIDARLEERLAEARVEAARRLTHLRAEQPARAGITTEAVGSEGARRDVPAGAGAGAEGSASGAPTSESSPAPCPSGMVAVAGHAGLCIDAHEFPGRRLAPRAMVSLEEARGLCRDRGARLCSSDEWETACHNLAPGRCNTRAGAGAVYAVSRAGRHRRCRTPDGAYDLVGNVAEWVEEGVVRGGDARTRVDRASCAAERRVPATRQSAYIGFRCCADGR